MEADLTPFVLLLVMTVSLLASVLTFYSGFGLGTLLLPVFALWFPLKEAVIMTAVVHLFNNLFKLVLVNKFIDRQILIRFGLPALGAAILGSLCLQWISEINIAYPVRIGPFHASLRVLNFILGLSIIIFGILEFYHFEKHSFGKRPLVLGGILSGFFGGLSGHQGVLRSAFLLKYHLSKEVFIGTGVAIACIVDIARLTMYSTDLSLVSGQSSYLLVAVSVTAAIVGAVVGNQFLKKVDINLVKKITATGIIIMGLAIMAGII
ncbi:MAG: sulfite exporter TauE/SafE family protein [Saprospiraceae bacterium]|nr:sulfite exporter TauE/SafE family protein [Saprospiraceae bacterium]